MIYDLSKDIDKQKAITRFKFLLEKGKKIDLKEKKGKKSLSSNNYAHLIMSWFALEIGETLDYVKREVFKKIVNSDLFTYERLNRVTGELRDDLRSFADLDQGETNVSIDRFRNYASKEFGIYLPDSSDLVAIDQMQNDVEQNKKWL